MNIYKSLNEVISYIENHLEEEISYSHLAKILCVNEYTFLRIFNLLANISVAEYIRNRRLSNAGLDLIQSNLKVLDIAVKYTYESSTSFSRAFEKFHGIKPSIAAKNPDNLKVYPVLHFDEIEVTNTDINYSIVELESFSLYGKGIKTKYISIFEDAPKFFKTFRETYFEKYGEPNYGMVVYESRYVSPNFEYWVLYNKKIQELEEWIFPKSKWIKFEIPSQKAKDIQEISQKFYKEFLPSCKYNLRNLPELEYYHENDNITEFLIPIEN